MSVDLYFDHHVAAAITMGLRRRGVDVLAAIDDGTSRLEDELLLARATELGRVLFTHDCDFLAITSRWQRDGRVFAGLVYASVQGISIGEAIRDLELIAKVLTADDIRSSIQYIPLS